MVHSRCSATAASATDRDAVGPGNVAGSATGLDVVAARAHAVAGTGSSAGAANPGDSVRHAAVVPAANRVGASCRCHDGLPSFDRDRVPTAVAVVAATPNHDSAAVAGAVVPNVAGVPATGESAPVAAARNAAGFPATGGSDPVAGRCCAVVVAAVPNVAGVPATAEPAAVAAARNAVGAADYQPAVADAAVPSVAVVQFGVAAVSPGDLVGLVGPAGPAGGYLVLVDVAAGAVRAPPDFPD